MHANRKVNDIWFRFLAIPVIAWLSHVIFFNENHGQVDEEFTTWQVWLIAVGEAILLWEGNRAVLLFFRKRFPLLQHTPKRITCQVLGCTVVTILIRYVNIWLYDQTMFWGYVFPPEGYIYNISIALLYVAIGGAFYEGYYYFQSWKETFKEQEQLQREYLQTQLASLKEQINPHFLFNNLSSLASLVMEDQHRAVHFINELSSVYRYLLQTNNDAFVSLQQELTFIQHYFHLLKTRFGSGIELEITIPQHLLKYQLPPLTIQLLLENAVKHNAILEDAPLKVEIYTEGEQVVVRNPKQVKSTPVFSGKTGLSNIRQKFRLLGGRPVQVIDGADFFRVIVPLFNEAYVESIGSRR